MLKDFKFISRNFGKTEEAENVPVDPKDSTTAQSIADSSRPPLNTIQDPFHIPKPEQDMASQNKINRTPKAKGKVSEPALSLRTPDKLGGSLMAKSRFGWAQKNEPSSIYGDLRDDRRGTAGIGNGGLAHATPRTATRTAGRATMSCSESNSTQSTPSKSVTKPPNSGIRSKADGNFNARLGNYAALYKGIPSSSGPPTVVNTVEVPHFDLKEDTSFWINHNVQVIIRVRPLNSMERATQGYNRCLKQENAHSITWIGQPETRFTFDHVACETIDQEILFRMAGLPMVENCLSGYNSCMFAYGQTGSGKTYTMLGEIEDLDVKHSPHRGMTPRIFEFLFARIQAEEESRRDENLKYNCKCSFLEIYNEQITDLLDPSSTNLLLREDVKKGVYVENLSEFEVHTVGDIIRLLTQGSANRKVAATNMNRESSRSHSVFTCVIESRWEKDSTTNFRFARLNLVDLAGSERQKTSGADGERLKEAANINKSLSTLGHVIMILVDVAQGKMRHIPYRDSKLTFLLQDSLGGNSKTMIIANVSPSICCTAETLNTLKFAQRAKLIQNNAVVNEDSTGDVIALQQQIRLLKEELSTLKHQNVSRSLSFGVVPVKVMKESLEGSSSENAVEVEQQHGDNLLDCQSKGIRMSSKQLKSLEATLAGALRREQMAETSVKQLEAEIEQLNRLVRQREEDTRSCKMMLRFREDKIRRMESLLAGSIPTDAYLQEENKALSDEIQLLQAKLDRNPEVTRFALENIRLLDQLRRFQEFYEEGEREILLAELSSLRDQLLQFHERNSMQSNPNFSPQPQVPCSKKEDDSVNLELRNTLNELEECRRNLNSCLEENAKLSREIDSLHSMASSINATQDFIEGPFHEAEAIPPKMMEGRNALPIAKHTEDILNLHLELDILKIILKEERCLRGLMDEQTTCLNKSLEMAKGEILQTRKQLEEAKGELKETKSVIEALESQQILSFDEMEDIKNKNSDFMELLRKQELEIMALKNQLASKELRDNIPAKYSEVESKSSLQTKLKKMHDSLEKAKQLNMLYQSDRSFQISNEEEMDEIRRQAEAETAEAIVCLQEELAALQDQIHDGHLKEVEMKERILHLESELNEVQEALLTTMNDKGQLSEELEVRDQELRSLAEECELLTSEIEEILADGCEALLDASDQVDHICNSFPQKRIWISEQFGMMARKISEKELLIDELSRCLEDASNKRSDMECMLKSLRSAALVITEAHQKDRTERDKEIHLLTSQLNDKISSATKLEEQLKLAEERIRKASSCATVAFVIVNRLSEVNLGCLDDLKRKDLLLSELAEINQRKDVHLKDQSASIVQAERHIAELQESCNKLRQNLSEEQEHSCDLEQRLKGIEKTAISDTREQLAALQEGVSSIRSSMASYAEHSECLDSRNSLEVGTQHFEDNDGARTGTGAYQDHNLDENSVEESIIDLADCSFYSVKGGNDTGSQNSRKLCKDGCARDVTIALLRKEIECALGNLKEVQDEMARLHKEKKEMSMSEKQSQQSIKCLTTELLALQVAMSDFEEQSKIKIEALSDQVKELEETLQEDGLHWHQTKEWLELEAGEAKIIATQKDAEAFCILAKFEEAQETIKEADVIINELMIANESMKHDVGRLTEKEVILLNEKDLLLGEKENLLSVINMKNKEIEDIVESNLIETKNILAVVDDVIKEFQTIVKENFISICCDFQCIKSQFSYSTKLLQSWLENVWSEIVVKDCTLSVLHLCHIGILIETMTGLHTENGLLSHGLCESNSLIGDLKEHNSKTRKELEMFGILKRKLLADIKNSFDRVSSKEKEASEITINLNSFEKKISDLQLQEEMMLQRSKEMESQLAELIRELDLSNTDVVTSLLDQEKILEQKVEVLESQAEFFIESWYCKDFESLIFALELENLACQIVDKEGDLMMCSKLSEHLKKEVICFQLEAEFTSHILMDVVVEVSVLKGEIQQKEVEKKDLLSELNQNVLKIAGMGELNKSLQQHIEFLEDDARSNNALKGELGKIKEDKIRLMEKNLDLEAEYDKLVENLIEKDVTLTLFCHQISFLDQQNKELHKVNRTLENSSGRLQKELKIRTEKLDRLHSLGDENELLRHEVEILKTGNGLVLQSLDKRISDFKPLSRCQDLFDKENSLLHDFISSLEFQIGSLQTDLETETTKLSDILHSQSVTIEELSFKCQEFQNFVGTVNELKEENASLQKRIRLYENILLSLEAVRSVDLVKTFEMKVARLSETLKEESLIMTDNMIRGLCENVEMASKFIKQFESLEFHAKELAATSSTLQAELSRKDDVIKGLLYDLSLLQESASECKDHKDEIEEMGATIETLEDGLAVKSGELAAAVANCQMLEAQLQDKSDIIGILELNLSREQESVKLLVSENWELKDHIEHAFTAKKKAEDELTEKGKLAESLENEISEMSSALIQMNELTTERDQLQLQVLSLKEKLEKAKAEVEENEAIAQEAQQVAESRKVYAEEKEAEVKLLERSVEELECTINVLENKVDIVKGEAERQRLQREELELHAVKHQMQNIRNADADMRRLLDEKNKSLEEALAHIQVLKRDLAGKDSEIAQMKAHISELNLYAEAQAKEYMQKFKALEAMAEQVKPEGGLSTYSCTSSNKSDKNATKSRGSGSPFKCIGLGLAQQIKSEKVEELAAARTRIEELESLAVCRQKEIFSLNAKLAAAESMTHDVIRDLLGVKLDMTTYVSLLDNQQVQKITEKAQCHALYSQEKEEEVIKLKKQLNEFIEERQGWLHEVDRKQAELVAAQIAMEKLRQRDHSLKTENEILKMENVNNKSKVLEMEEEIRKLSGQQNLQQRIHHHAKIKEENNKLKIQNEELSTKLRRSEIFLSRVKEELSSLRVSAGINPCIDFEEEQRLMVKLKGIEEEKMLFAQQLLRLCTNVLKAAGITKPASDINPSMAEKALEELKNRIASLELEKQDLKYKNKIIKEKIKLSELMPQTSSLNSRTEENRVTPPRVSQSPFLSSFDR
ncbi:kinesin-like protein KIN-12D isoform X2 [Prosopis cineraria]|uniref:kinesin-like protein KIN-12D isoform X2 n=1 Tax=Prosopis cineraria TaxID=364024 RepID=UPI0024100416|nr:kinesin-like protein KIN-12D isoform X2 [Prosopis cineraria]